MGTGIFDFKHFIRRIRGIYSAVRGDLITVFAAQASFFIIISSIPFTVLLCSLLKYVTDTAYVAVWLQSHLSGELGSIVTEVFANAVSTSGVPLVSITAVSTIWASSRGVSAVMRGVSEVYGNRRMNEFFLIDILRSIIYTLIFVAIIVVSVLIVIFGRSLGSFNLPLLRLLLAIPKRIGSMFFVIVMTLFFALIYYTAATKGRRISQGAYRKFAKSCPKGYRAQLPGAFFASVAWALFSYFYSMYITVFPQSSYIYGSLAALAFMMLWLYTCMIILLLGGEVNKYFWYKRRERNHTS